MYQTHSKDLFSKVRALKILASWSFNVVRGATGNIDYYDTDNNCGFEAID